METGRRLFFDEGFSAITTDRLAKEAGVSKTSIYKYFGSMDGVFEAVVTLEGNAFTLGVTEHPETPEEFWLSIARYGENLLTLLRSRRVVQFHQMIQEEVRNHTHMVQIYYHATYERTHAYVAELIEHGKRRGFVTKPLAANDLADNLLSMWEGLAFVRARLGLDAEPSTTPKRWANQCVETLFGVTLP